MPFTCVSLQRGTPSERKRAIARAVHEAVLECTRPSSEAAFQIVAEYGDDEFLGEQGLEPPVVVQVTLPRGRSDASRQRLRRRIADGLAASAGVDPRSVLVYLAEGDQAEGHVGGGVAVTHGPLASQGCALAFPDERIPALFPGATRFTASAVSLSPAQLGSVASRPGARCRERLEPLDVPYTVYEVFRGDERAGHVLGCWQRGHYGRVEVFVAVGTDGAVRAVHVQELRGPRASRLRRPSFLEPLVGLRASDLASLDPVTLRGPGKLASLAPPTPELEDDFAALMWAVVKAVVVLDALGSRPATTADRSEAATGPSSDGVTRRLSA